MNSEQLIIRVARAEDYNEIARMLRQIANHEEQIKNAPLSNSRGRAFFC